MRARSAMCLGALFSVDVRFAQNIRRMRQKCARAARRFCRNNANFTEKYRVDLIQKAALVMGDCVDYGKQLKALARAGCNIRLLNIRLLSCCPTFEFKRSTCFAFFLTGAPA